MELGYLNVQVNAIAPGIIKTGFSQVLWQTPQIADPVLKGLASGRFGKKVSGEPQKTSFGRLRTGSFAD